MEKVADISDNLVENGLVEDRGTSERSAQELSTLDQALIDKTVLEQMKWIRTHYYVKIAVSAFMSAILLIIGVPVFMASRVTGSMSYTALGIVLVGFGLILAAAVVILLFRPPFQKVSLKRR